MTKIIRYVFNDLLRTRFILLYTLVLLAGTLAVTALNDDAGKVTVSILSIVLMVVPLVSIVFSTIHFYNSYEFISLMLAQPIHRRVVFMGEYAAVGLSLCLAYVAGVGLPLVFYGLDSSGLSLIVTGCLLTLVFVSLAFLSSVLTFDKSKAIGIALAFWFYFSLLYDGLVLLVLFSFSDYPLEKATLVMVAMNPIDLARITILLKLDISALMGYTGAFYRDFFGTRIGAFFSIFTLSLWVILPAWMAMRVFSRKDL